MRQFTHRAFRWAILSLVAAWLVPVSAVAQVAPGAPASATALAPRLSAAEIEKLVGPVALYPDDLLAILLPASTTPLDIVKAQRYLEKRKSNPKLQPDPSLPEPVRNLLNYPDVVKKMSDDLDWTERLGKAVANQQKDVVNAIQAFRRKVYAVGNLKTDDKQIIVVEKEVIKIVQADPKVIYVPQYQPSVVVVAQPVPVAVYYPTPYPVYYYGASTAYAFGWYSSTIYYGYDVEDLQEERMDYAREAREDWQEHRKEMQGQRQERPSQTPTQKQEAARGTQAQPSQTLREQAKPQPSATASQTQRQQGAGASQPSGQPWSPQTQVGQVGSAQGTRPGDSQFSRGGGAFGGGGSSADMASASQRGLQSRSGSGWSSSGGGFGGRGGGGA
ncbi:DUF3300 domain-containing protein, partial [Candidatus Methylomirabilis sp.]|uniref:DUF3300 domain-containing protein n=1 Tax=Candidatus Methylomirabilis sp. TaxID=2032687 RepID=UPI0030766DBA